MAAGVMEKTTAELTALQPHSRLLQTLDISDDIPTDTYPLHGLLEYVQQGTIQWKESFLRACQYYIVEPPIEEAVHRHIRLHGNIEHAWLAVRLGLCPPSILDWFGFDQQQKIRHGILFGVPEPAVYSYAVFNHVDVVKYLVEEQDSDFFFNEYALQEASRYGQLDVVKYLVKQGVDYHALGEEALQGASKNGHLDIVTYLVSQGADIHANNDAALCVASQNGHLGVVKYLVSQGADIHANYGFAWHIARYCGYLDIVTYLAEQGADTTIVPVRFFR